MSCYSSVAVSGLDDVGGLVGWNEQASIAGSYATGAVSGRDHIGGLIGYDNSSTISNSYATGAVSGGDWFIGGLIGLENSYSTITHCYSAGLVTGGIVTGGLIGSFYGTIHDCFWDTQTSGMTLGVGDGNNIPNVTGKTTAEMRSYLTFVNAGWDFDNVWRMREGLEYPRLNIALPYAGGDGSVDDPYQIATAGQLNALGGYAMDWDKSFILTSDIDMTGYIYSRAVIAWNPVNASGFMGHAFTGIFDGKGHIISNLRVSGSYYSGLFGKIAAGGSVSDLNLVSSGINATVFYSGAVAGSNDGTITNCRASGYVSGDSIQGGLVGTNAGIISSCYAKGSVNGSQFFTGGLVGENTGTISNSYSNSTVYGVSHYTGGLASSNSGIVSNCYSTGTVGSTGEYLGGLLGYSSASGVTGSFWDVESSGLGTAGADNFGAIGKTMAQMKSQATFTDAGWDFDNIWWISEGIEYPRHRYEFYYDAGDGTELKPFEIATASQLDAIGDNPDDWDNYFILTADIDMTGYIYGRAVIAYDSNPNNIDFDGPDFMGNFNGNNHSIRNLTINAGNYCGLFGKVNYGGSISNLGIESVYFANVGIYAGALAGSNDGSITNCYSSGSVDGAGFVGGLVGENNRSIQNCHSVTNIQGYGEDVGGLAGINNSIITGSYTAGTVNGANRVGGLVGINYGSITSCYTEGSSGGNSNIGGLVGYNENYGRITSSYSTGSVTGSSRVGGLSGYNYGQINSSYSAAQVNGGDYVGGLLGVNGSYAQVNNSYARGNTSGRDDIGGLVGVNNPEGYITNCYSTGTVSGRFNINGLVGLNAAGYISNCFWDTQTSGKADPEAVGADTDGMIGYTTAGMQTLSNFTVAGWDFIDENANGTNDYWLMDSYPVLSWQEYRLFNLYDFAVLAQYWQTISCINTDPCGGADLNDDSDINIDDLYYLAENWLGRQY